MTAMNDHKEGLVNDLRHDLSNSRDYKDAWTKRKSIKETIDQQGPWYLAWKIEGTCLEEKPKTQYKRNMHVAYGMVVEIIKNCFIRKYHIWYQLLKMLSTTEDKSNLIMASKDRKSR
mgnify:CR=1 FL=1